MGLTGESREGSAQRRAVHDRGPGAAGGDCGHQRQCQQPGRRVRQRGWRHEGPRRCRRRVARRCHGGRHRAGEVVEPEVRQAVGRRIGGERRRERLLRRRRLVEARSPAAKTVEIHEMAMVDNMMKMRAVQGGLELPAGKTVELKPGSYHECDTRLMDGIMTTLVDFVEIDKAHMQTVWGDDKRFVSTYWQSFEGRMVYSTFDWGIKDKDGYFFILGRTDDVINVAGHRLGTREIEESISSHSNVAEVAVVGVEDQLKGQVAIGFVIAKDPSKTANMEAEVMKTVDSQLGAVARPARIYLVSALPKTRSGKIVRRALQAVAEGRDPGDISTMEDQSVLAQIKQVIGK